MPYPIHRYASNQSGTPFVTLNDREVNSTASSLRLLGRFTPGYGEALNENLLWLLENFASTTAPSNALSGQLWFNSGNNSLNYRDQAGNWREAARRVAGSTAPTDGPPVGQLWFNTGTNALQYLDGLGQWREAARRLVQTSAPSSAPAGQIWLNSTDNSLQYFDAAGNWREAARRIAQTSAPAATPVGQLWFNTSSDTLNFRDNSGDWQEIVSQNGSFTARYADVAERYAASGPVEPGDLVEIGGEEEIQLTQTDASQDVFGVVSTSPAVRMNAGAGTDETHPYIALVGRVPCKVTGPVRKGQRLVSSEVPGVARGAGPSESALAIIGRSLSDDDGEATRLVEIVLGSR